MATKKLDIKKPILIEGLPGMGNVGKIAVDFIVDSLKAKKFCEIHSKHFPNCVFVNDKNLIEVPRIILYHKKIGKRDFVFVCGDVQPVSEVGCYDLCSKLLDLFPDVSEVVTLGGIGLDEVPLDPKIFAAGTNKKILEKYKLPAAKGNVGPVIGVSGVLAGIAKSRKIPGVIILSQTLAHPTYLGVQGARKILKKLNTVFRLGLDTKSLDKEVKDIEKEIREKIDKLMMVQEKTNKDHMSYIG